MPELQFETSFNPTPDAYEPINRGLYEYNLLHLGPDITHNYLHVVVWVRGEDGKVVAGLIGEMFWDWLHIETLWVEQSFRGQDIGTRLVRQAEAAALEKGFHHAQLETTTFQARAFYEKNGYQVFATLEGKPPGHTWYYMRKDL